MPTVKELFQSSLANTEIFPDFRFLGDPILRIPSEKVNVEKGREIGERLGDILVKYWKKNGFGRGLAAPQIGESKRVFVTYLKDKIQIYINPEIIWNSDKTNFYREFCLSNGPIWGDIERPASITMRWTDINGEQQEKTVDDFLARCWQHECDHLDGIVCLDKAVLGTIGFATSSPLAEKLRGKPINFFPVDKP